MPHSQKTSLLPTLAMLAVAISWGASFSVVKTALDYYKPEFMVFARLALGASIFLLFFSKLRRIKIQKADWPIFIIMILCEPCIFFLLESHALTYTTASQAGLIVATSPLFTAIAAWIFLKERPGKLMWLGFFVAIFGIAMLSFDAVISQHAPNPVLGNILEAISMCAGAGFVICVKKLGTRYPPFFMAAMQAIGGASFFLILITVTGTSIPSTFELTPLLCIIYLGVFITFAAITLFNYGVAKLPAATSAGLLNLVPLIAVLIGNFILDENMSTGQWIACGLVLLGVMISQRAKVHKK